MHLMVWDDESTWPAPLLAYLENSTGLFLGWNILEEGRRRTTAASDYDRACFELRKILNAYSLLGWHCTRLTCPEIVQIRTQGMRLPNLRFLQTRVAALVQDGTLSSEIAEILLTKHEASDSNRAEMIWFCFFPPRRAGQSGIERFFRSWGGEALYNSHEDDALMGPILNKIGIPYIVEAAVPVAGLNQFSFLETHLVRRFLLNRGYSTQEHTDHEDRCLVPLSAGHILRVIKHPSNEFARLTGCESWDPRL